MKITRRSFMPVVSRHELLPDVPSITETVPELDADEGVGLVRRPRLQPGAILQANAWGSPAVKLSKASHIVLAGVAI